MKEPRAAPPSSFWARSRISAAALFVNVTAAMARGSTPPRTRCASRWVMTRVLPEPAPARTSSGPFGWRTASRCSGLRVSSRESGMEGGFYRRFRRPRRREREPAAYSTVTDFARFRG